MGNLQITEQFVAHAASPAVVMAMIEALVWEKKLRRAKASAMEDRLLHQVDVHGCWQGDPWDGRERLGVLPPDVERFANIDRYNQKKRHMEERHGRNL